MRVGIIVAYMDYHRKGRHHRGVLQPQIGPLIAALLPPGIEVEVANDTWEDPDWTRDYDLLFISSMHSDFDRAKQISHYWRRRGATTVYGGIMASTYARLCAPYFDSIVIGDPEDTVPRLFEDFQRKQLQPVYVSSGYDARLTPVPRFDLLARKQPVPISLEVTRGCPFTCEFCALTGLGTRHHTRPVELVVRDIKAARRILRGMVPDYKLLMAVFCDNNIGGNLGYLRSLCEALTPLKQRWGSAITFNAVANGDIVQSLSRAGCRFLFMGLESFNKEAIMDMHKVQNTVDKTKLVMDQCRANGILIVSGLMINPITDSCDYLRSIPASLSECGLHVPSFICFESPIPGTPHFHRLAAEQEPALLPNALLRDFNGYTLVTRPKREPLDRLLEAYRKLMKETFSLKSKLKKWADDVPRFAKGGYWVPAVIDVVAQLRPYRPQPDRTYIAGTDTPPPESFSVPLTEADFVSDEERRLILEPMKVTDGDGRVLPEWLDSTKIYEPRGAVSANARQLVTLR